MAITNTEIRRMPFGNLEVVYGKSELSGTASSGDVVTGLNNVEMFFMDIQGDTASACSVNATFPLSTGTVPVVVETADSTFYWEAYGKGK